MKAKLLPLRIRSEEQACCACGIVKPKSDFPDYALDSRHKSRRCNPCWDALWHSKPRTIRRNARV